MIVIASKRKKPETILPRYPGAVIADVACHAGDDMEKSRSIINGRLPLKRMKCGILRYGGRSVFT